MPGYPDNLKFYQPIHFKIEELVDPLTYSSLGAMAMQLLDWRILYSLDCIRELLGVPLIVNNWKNGGNRKYSGFRPIGCEVGGYYSQHRFGRAVDFISPEMEASKIRLEIMSKNRLFPFISYMEDNVEWVHIDVRASTFNGIHIFKP